MIADLSVPAPEACIHHGLVVDRYALSARNVAAVDCDGRAGPLIAIAGALRFPEYYGGNWDALDECLRDLDTWWPAAGWVVVVSDAAGDAWRQLELCWQDAARHHAVSSCSLHLVYP